MEASDLYISSVQETDDVERNGIELQQSVHMAAMATIPKSPGRLIRKAVLLWDGTCEETVSKEKSL